METFSIQHLSQLSIEQYVLEELDSDEVGEVESHLSSCVACKQKEKTARAGFSALGELDLDKLLEAVTPKTEEADAPPKRSGVFLTLMPLVSIAAAVVLFFAIRPSSEKNEKVDTIRAKGSISLQLFVLEETLYNEFLSGGVLREGDRIRFRVRVSPDLPQIMIIGEEADGSQSLYYPRGGGDESSAIEELDDGTLRGAVSLDGSIGKEKVYLVACPTPFRREEIRVTSAEVHSLPSGCIVDVVDIRKE